MERPAPFATFTVGGAVTAMATSPDTRFLVCGDSAGGVTLWDVRAGTTVWTRKGHERAVDVLAISPDGRMLVSGPAQGDLRVWVLPEGASHPVTLAGMVFGEQLAWEESADDYNGYLLLNTYLAGCAFDGAGAPGHRLILLHKLQFGPDGAPGPNYGSVAVRGAMFDLDGGTDLGGGGEPGAEDRPETERQVWRPSAAWIYDTTLRHDRRRTEALLGPDGRTAAVGADMIDVLHAATGVLTRTLGSQADPAGHPLAVGSAGGVLVSGGGGRPPAVWDLRAGTPMAMQADVFNGARGWGFAVSADEQQLAVSADDGTVRIHALPGGDLVGVTSPLSPATDPGTGRLERRDKDAERGILAHLARFVGLTGRPEAAVPAPSPRAPVVSTIAFSRDGRLLFGAARNAIAMWKTEDIGR